MNPPSRVAVAGSLASILLQVVAPSPARAHTESDVVAVPATEPATVRLVPTHGCDGSPTVAVRTRVPIADAQADPVEGWTATATPDDAGNVVLEWTGGVLPADEEGAFPVSFTTPDTVGQLLTFPFIQACENGAELAWIDGDPDSEYPAPRVLVLPAGSAPAATIDDVPADAAGRELLTAVADVDNPAATTIATTTLPTTTVAPSTTAPSTTAETTTTAPTPSAPATSGSASLPAATSTATTSDPDDDGDGAGGVAVPIAIGLAVLAALAVAAWVLRRRRDEA